MPFKSGNKEQLKGRHDHLFRDAIVLSLKSGGGQKLRALVDKMVELAEAGDVQAAKLIIERVDGRPRQEIDVTSNGESFAELAAGAEKLKAQIRG